MNAAPQHGKSCNLGGVTRPITMEEVAISRMVTQRFTMNARDAPSIAEQKCNVDADTVCQASRKSCNIMDADRSTPVQQRSDQKKCFGGAYCKDYQDTPNRVHTSRTSCPRLVRRIVQPRLCTQGYVPKVPCSQGCGPKVFLTKDSD